MRFRQRLPMDFESNGSMVDERKLQALLEPGERERPTLKTIARISGLAVPTVSRALSDAPDIGRDTKKRVRELADQLGYRPNRAGLRLRTGKTNVIALVLRTEDDVMSHASRLITAIASELRETAYHVIITPYFPDEDPLTPVRYIARTGSADGVILNRIQPEDPRIQFLRDRKIPFAMHGRTSDCENAPFYDFDNRAFACRAVETLAARGRREMLLVAPPQDQNYALEMIDGARQAGRTQGVRVHVLGTASSDSPSAQVRGETLAFLEAHPEIDAIMTASVPSAVAATLGAEACGRVIGADLDMISKESMPILKDFRREILVVAENITEAGQFLARAIIQAIDEPEKPPMQKLVAPT